MEKIIRKIKILFAVLIVALFGSLCIMQTTGNSAYAGLKFEIINKGNEGGGGTPKLPLNLIIDAQHASEISNFATISNQAVTGYNSIRYPIASYPDFETDYNHIDFVICMIKKLEKFAETYCYGVRPNINNNVLAYIRSFNKNYTGESEHQGTTIFNKSFWGFDYWQILAGMVNFDFITKYKTQEADLQFGTIEFFASYIPNEESFNRYLHNNLNVDYIISNEQRPLLKLPDPLGSGQTIDLLHMIAAIDGIYERTEFHDTTCKVFLGNKHFQRDLVSWLGDLQTLARDMGLYAIDVNKLKNYSSEMGHIDFNDFINEQTGVGVSSFSSDDLLADIDAFNITNFYLNNGLNSLSDSIIGYYTTVKNDGEVKGNRYSSFIFNSTLELNQESTGNLEQDFRNEVCNALNVKYENGNYYDCTYYSEDSYNLKLMNRDGICPSFAIRKYCAKLFCDYIIAMSHRF